MDKYEITGETRLYNGHLLHRIRRLSDGLLGGWIGSTYNLSQEGSCFIYDDAIVYEYAQVKDDAQIKDKAVISDHAIIFGTTEVTNGVEIGGDIKLGSDFIIIAVG